MRKWVGGWAGACFVYEKSGTGYAFLFVITLYNYIIVLNLTHPFFHKICLPAITTDNVLKDKFEIYRLYLLL